MVCKWLQDEFCTNDDCPLVADYCPVSDDPGVCRHEDREEDKPVRKTREVCYGSYVGFEEEPTQEQIEAAKEMLAERMKRIIIEKAAFGLKKPDFADPLYFLSTGELPYKLVLKIKFSEEVEGTPGE